MRHVDTLHHLFCSRLQNALKTLKGGCAFIYTGGAAGNAQEAVSMRKRLGISSADTVSAVVPFSFAFSVDQAAANAMPGRHSPERTGPGTHSSSSHHPTSACESAGTSGHGQSEDAAQPPVEMAGSREPSDQQHSALHQPDGIKASPPAAVQRNAPETTAGATPCPSQACIGHTLYVCVSSKPWLIRTIADCIAGAFRLVMHLQSNVDACLQLDK